MYRIACVVGTRPEAIKMAPLILTLKKDKRFAVTVLATGQHTEMLHQALSHFGIAADVDLNIMRDRQTLDHITSAVLTGVGGFLDESPQDMLLVHGDTSTTVAAALAGFYRHIPVGHVEAGLRSHDMSLPFPEEANRVLTDQLATLFFAPTRGDAENLKREGLSQTGKKLSHTSRIHVTGNTVIDALFWTLKNLKNRPEPEALQDIPEDAPLILMTAHRRESWGEPLHRICGAVADLLRERPEIHILIPLHKNPTVREAIRRDLGAFAEGTPPQVIFTEPLNYPDFVSVMDRSLFILSDSGGIQEEASALKKPVLILRTLSERPDAVTQGTGVLVGTDPERILSEARRLLDNAAYRQSFASRESAPFGDGTASVKIRDIIAQYLEAGA